MVNISKPEDQLKGTDLSSGIDEKKLLQIILIAESIDTMWENIYYEKILINESVCHFFYVMMLLHSWYCIMWNKYRKSVCASQIEIITPTTPFFTEVETAEYNFRTKMSYQLILLLKTLFKKYHFKLLFGEHKCYMRIPETVWGAILIFAGISKLVMWLNIILGMLIPF